VALGCAGSPPRSRTPRRGSSSAGGTARSSISGIADGLADARAEPAGLEARLKVATAPEELLSRSLVPLTGAEDEFSATDLEQGVVSRPSVRKFRGLGPRDLLPRSERPPLAVCNLSSLAGVQCVEPRVPPLEEDVELAVALAQAGQKPRSCPPAPGGAGSCGPRSPRR
jgi:hypothetical protein